MAVATSLPGIVAVFALIFTYISVNQGQQQLQVAEQGQITDRYNDAVVDLGSTSLDERIGGIYALQGIMQDSSRDEPSIIEILCSFIRVRSPAQPWIGVQAKDIDHFPTAPGADIEAAAEVLASRPPDNIAPDLNHADLAGLNLSDAEFADADLSGTDLRGSILNGADLSGATLYQADLYGTILDKSRLTGLILNGANLADASIIDTNSLTVEQLVSAAPSRLDIPKGIPASDPRVIAWQERAN